MIPTKTDEPEPVAPPEPDRSDGDQRAREAALRARLETRPIVTWVLLGVQLVMFVAESALGGSEVIPVLGALGGLSHDSVARGEIWRLVSCSFLHAGIAHVGLNSYVLVLLGTRVERLLGSARYLVLYTAATIGAGLMSYFTSSAIVTVGASGGIFGLLAAEAIFVFTKRSALLPPALRAARQRGALINLALNIGISFQPHVSLSAHAGGAIVGASMMLLGFAPRDHDTNETTHPFIRVLAGGSALVLGAALAAGIACSGALGFAATPSLTRTSVPELGWSMELPTVLVSNDDATTTGNVVEATWGDIYTQPAAIAIARVPRDDASTIASDEAQLQQFEQSFHDTPPEGATLSDIARGTAGDRPTVVARYTYPNGLVFERLIVVRTTDLARIDTVVWPTFEGAYLDASRRTASSITPLAQ